jgi:hypothetical protein
MLEKIFSSKARVKILKIFLLNPDEKYYIRQLSRELRLQVNSVRRELNNLEEFGLLSSSKDNSIKDNNLSREEELANSKFGAKKYYKVNRDFILFSEIRSLIVKAQILAGESFIKNLKLVCDPKFILLGGMFTNNESAPTDILIVASLEKNKLLEIINELELELSSKVNFTVMDEDEFKYRQEVADVFLHSVLNSRNIILLDKILNKEEK